MSLCWGMDKLWSFKEWSVAGGANGLDPCLSRLMGLNNVMWSERSDRKIWGVWNHLHKCQSTPSTIYCLCVISVLRGWKWDEMNINNFMIATPGKRGLVPSGVELWPSSAPAPGPRGCTRLKPTSALSLQCTPLAPTLGAGTPRFPVQLSQGLFLGLGGPLFLAHLLKKGPGVCLGVGGRGQGTGSEDTWRRLQLCLGMLVLNNIPKTNITTWRLLILGVGGIF